MASGYKINQYKKVFVEICQNLCYLRGGKKLILTENHLIVEIKSI